MPWRIWMLGEAVESSQAGALARLDQRCPAPKAPGPMGPLHAYPFRSIEGGVRVHDLESYEIASIEVMYSITYAVANLDAGGGAPGWSPCSTRTGGIAALRRRGKRLEAVHRRRALHYPRWRSHIRDRLYVIEYLGKDCSRD